MSSQFIEQWNNVFDFKLRESDLQNPTEQIVTSALFSYLEHININVNKMREVRLPQLLKSIRFV